MTDLIAAQGGDSAGNGQASGTDQLDAQGRADRGRAGAKAASEIGRGQDPVAAVGPTRAELAEALAVYDAAVPPGQRYGFDISGLDRLGMTVMIEAFRGEPDATDGFGYGASPDEARVGALGELHETIALMAKLKSDAGETGSFFDMVRRHGADRVLDPLTLCLPAGSDYDPALSRRWVRFRRWPEGEAFAPREFAALGAGSYAHGATSSPPPLIVPITNGMGAGLSLEQALAHGVLELLQRDGNAVRFRAMDHGTVIDLATVDDPFIVGLIGFLREHGIEPLAKLAATDFGLVNLYVVDEGSVEPPFPLMATACGEAAHPNANQALRKAMLEFMAARSRKAMMHGPLDRIAAIAPPGYLDMALAGVDLNDEEPRTLREMLDWISRDAASLREILAGNVLRERRRVAFAALPSLPDAVARDPARRLADLAARLEADGMAIYYYDCPMQDTGVSVVKALVPGLECETMSYYRIAARGVAKLIEDDSGFASLGRMPLGARAKRVRLTSAAEETLGGPAWLDTAGVDRIVGALYPLYREPGSHGVQVALGRG